MREAKKTTKKSRHIGRWVLGIFLIIIIALGGYGFYLYHSVHSTVDKTYTPLKKGTANDSDLKDKKPISILLLGTDTGDLGRTEKRGRTDTMILITLNPKTEKTTMTSIPRDTMAQMVGMNGTNIQKINAAYNFGGADMTVNTVTSLLNVPVNYYALVNMGGLTKVVDAVGGVDVKPLLSFKYSGYTFKKGQETHMNGNKALAYSRMRYQDPNNDYGRQERQQQVIMSILKAAPSFKSLTNFETLMKQVQSNLRTNMNFDTMVSIFKDYRGAANQVTRDHMQGVGAYIGESSYQITPTKELQRVSDEARKNLNLNTEKISNEETKQNDMNKGFNWNATNNPVFTIHDATN